MGFNKIIIVFFIIVASTALIANSIDISGKPDKLCLNRQCTEKFLPEDCQKACVAKGYKLGVCEYVGKGCCCEN